MVRSHSLSRQELKRKLESADDSDLVMEQGKATIKSVKKELRLLQKAEEEQNQGESARATAAPSRPQTAPHGPRPPHSHHAGVSAMVKKLCEAHDEALREIEERESSHFAALQGNDGDDDILSSDL